MRPGLRDIAWRLAGLFRRERMERRLDAEMGFHLEMLTDRHIAGGLPADEARRRALAEFGGTERFKDDARDEYRSRIVDEIGLDVRYAGRVLRHHPGFTVAAVLTFALGIGASAAVFSVVNAVLLRALPYADPDRLVVVWERHAGRGVDRNVVAVPNFEAWRQRSRSFEGMAGLVPMPATIGGAPNPERVIGAEVSPGYFRMLGVAPALGREFTADEESNGGANVLVLSDAFWRSRFGADPAIIGRTVPIDGRPHTVVGVMPAFEPPRFAWLTEQAFWRPFGATDANRSWGRFLLVVARLKGGTTLDAARREMAAIAGDLARERSSNVGWSASVTPLESDITGDVRRPLLVLLGAVGLLLVMAVANVANLTLGLTRRRDHELAVRRAIGATSWRLVRQLVTQSAVVGILGCLIGAFVAIVGVRMLIALLPPEIPRAASIRVDGPVLAFMVTAAAISSVVIGLVSAWRTIPTGVEATLRESGGGRSARRLRGGGLVTAEIAIGLVLTVLAGLMVRTFSALRAVDVGFEPVQVVAARVGLSGPRYATPAARSAFFAELAGRLHATPGVEAAGVISMRPFGGAGPATTAADANAKVAGDSVIADVRFADGPVFQALRIPLLSGSVFDAQDRADAPPRVVINQTLAQTLWPRVDPIGRHLRLELFNGITPEVIGVVGDVHLMDARTPPRAAAYLADARFPSEVRDVILRGRGGGDQLVAAIRAAVSTVDATIPVYQITTLDGLVGAALARDRFTTMLLGGFAAVSLLLGAVGIYGVFAGDVVARRKEIGIRIALGSSAGAMVRLVIGRAASRAVMGVVIGGASALLVARAMKSMLFGVGSSDPLSFIVVTALLLSVAFAATLIPALRAARVSPLVAIRTD